MPVPKHSEYEKSVFVNCPFDKAYQPLFQAIVFAVHECGFVARCSLERADASELRVDKIYDLIRSSKYGVHDLSRLDLDKQTNLPRFNMPLELGIFLGAKFLGDANQRSKNCLVFDEEPYRYQMYLSDIAGQDIVSHHNDVQTVISCIRNWLAHEVNVSLPGGKAIMARYEQFERELIGIGHTEKQEPDEMSYPDLIRHISAFTSCKSDCLQSGRKMRWGEELHDPSLSHIKEVLDGLRGDADSFLILVKAGTGRSYIQVHGSERDGYLVECQDGGAKQHFRCTSQISKEQLTEILRKFRGGSREWWDLAEWQAYEF